MGHTLWKRRLLWISRPLGETTLHNSGQRQGCPAIALIKVGTHTIQSLLECVSAFHSNVCVEIEKRKAKGTEDYMSDAARGKREAENKTRFFMKVKSEAERYAFLPKRRAQLPSCLISRAPTTTPTSFAALCRPWLVRGRLGVLTVQYNIFCAGLLSED